MESTRYRNLCTKLEEFRSKGAFCDIEINIQNKIFKAHKIILASSSQYFQVMFLGSLAVKHQCSVILQDINPDIFNKILQFCYGWELDVNSENVEGLIVAADMLQFSEVVSICADYLKEQLHPSNCVGIYCFAKQHTFTKLKKLAWKFILSHFVQVCFEDEFLILPYEDLLCLVKSEKIAVENEMNVLQSALRWLSHDLPTRRRHFVSLFKHVRINLIPFQDVSKLVESIPDFCLKVAVNVLVQDLQPGEINSSPSKQKSIHNTSWQPRQSARKGYYAIGGCIPNHSHRYQWENNAMDPVSYIERFDSFTKKWDPFPISLRESRTNLAAVALNEKIYAVGGERDSMIYGSMECYDTVLNQWQWDLPPLAVPRCSCQAVTWGANIYILGGYVGSGVGKSIECFNTDTNQCELVNFSMQTERHSFGAVCLDNVIYMAGGVGSSECELRSVECYDLDRHDWWLANEMQMKRAYFSLVALKGLVYAIGGYNGIQGTLKSVEVFDPFTNTWKSGPPMKRPRAGAFAAIMDDKIIIIGGKCKKRSHESGVVWRVLDDAEVYDPETNQWADSNEMGFDSRCDGVALVV